MSCWLRDILWIADADILAALMDESDSDSAGSASNDKTPDKETEQQPEASDDVAKSEVTGGEPDQREEEVA